MGIIILRSFGNSMYPLLHDHDVLYLKRIKMSLLRVNDIVGVKVSNNIVIHRVVHIEKKSLITKGDNNLLSDNKINKNKIFVVVYKIKRKNKMFFPEQFYLFQSTIYLGELEKINKAFQLQEVPYIVLKGLPLYLHIERSHPRRLYMDCDILIKHEDFAKSVEILKKLGYKHKINTKIPFLNSDKEQINIESSYIKIVNDIPVIIDLHQSIAFMMTQVNNSSLLYPQNQVELLTKEMFDRRKSVSINKIDFFLLSSMDLIIYLALHIFHHNFQGSTRYEMLNAILCLDIVNEGNFIKMYSVIKKYRLENFIYPVFILLIKHYQSPYAYDIAQNITPKRSIVKFTNDTILTLNIFDNQSRVQAGITRFKNLFMLSPVPIYARIFVFFNPNITLTIFRYILARIKSLTFANDPRLFKTIN